MEESAPLPRHSLGQNPPSTRRTVPFSDEDALRIQKNLDRTVEVEDIQFRPSAQGSVAYVEGWKALSLANEVFGFNGWSSEILSITTDFVEMDAGKISLGMSCMVRIHLRDGTFHDVSPASVSILTLKDIGYGSAENQRSKVAAYEKARKEAVTDAMKRALRIFGSRLGNCAYDKSFLRKIKSGKREPGFTNTAHSNSLDPPTVSLTNAKPLPSFTPAWQTPVARSAVGESDRLGKYPEPIVSEERTKALPLPSLFNNL